MTMVSAPSVHADLLALRRAGWNAVARTCGGPVLLVMVCVVLAAVPLYRDPGWLIVVSAVLALAGSHGLTRHRLTAALVRARFGWCGALPVRSVATSGALVALTVAALGVAVVSGSLLLVCAAIPAPHRDALGFGLLAVDGGLVVGTLAAIVLALRKGTAVKLRHAEGIREPLFALPWLDDARLPHLPDWQRRCALVRWRGGGGFALVGVVLAGVPMGAAVFDVAGLVLLALALAWLAVVMRACAATTSAARSLLGATPVSIARVRRVSLRYPLAGWLGSMALAALGAALLRGGFATWVGWVVCAAAVSLRPWLRIAGAIPPGRSP